MVMAVTCLYQVVCATLLCLLSTEQGLLSTALCIAGICLFTQSLPLVPWGVPALFLCLTAGVLILMGYGLLPELSLPPLKPIAAVSVPTAKPEQEPGVDPRAQWIKN